MITPQEQVAYAAITKAFEEAKHPRNKGKFAPKHLGMVMADYKDGAEEVGAQVHANLRGTGLSVRTRSRDDYSLLSLHHQGKKIYEGMHDWKSGPQEVVNGLRPHLLKHGIHIKVDHSADGSDTSLWQMYHHPKG
jgi:hypothetical protein